MRKIILLALLCMLCVPCSLAQITSPRSPRSFSDSSVVLSADVPKISVDPVSLSKAAVHPEENGLQPFAKALAVDVPFMDLALRDSVAGGSIYRLSLKSGGAYSVGLVLTDYALSPGCELYIYGSDLRFAIGAVTSDANNVIRELRTAQIPGDSVVLELFVPYGASQKSFIISRLYHDFSDFFADFALSANGNISKATSVCSTHMDLACYSGHEYDVIQQAVLKYTFDHDGYLYICTGTLVNSLNCDSQPLVLSAAHCICSEEEASTATFYFNYKLNDCCGSLGDYQTMSGASVLATSYRKPHINRFGVSSSQLYPVLDFSLLRISHEIPKSYKPYFAGISLSQDGGSQKNVSCLHHPNGNTMKLSISHSEPYTDSYPESDPDCHYNGFSHWHIDRWDVGTTEGGSSGSALLDDNMMVIGILSGGYASCFSPVNDFFQKVSDCWNLYPAPGEQLKYWLAPQSDVMEVPPYDPFFVADKLPRARLSAVCDSDSLVAHLSWEAVAPVSYSGGADSIAVGGGYILPKISISGGDVLTFRARSLGGGSVLSIGHNVRPQRFKTLAGLEVGEEWADFSVSLSQLSGSGAYIKFWVSADSLPDIAIGGVRVLPADCDYTMSTLTGYQLWCNGQLMRTLPAGVTSCDFDITHGSSYSFYILNSYGDDVSSVCNIVTLAPGCWDANTPVGDIGVGRGERSLLLYPNPARGHATVGFPDSAGDVRLDILDMAGRVCRTTRLEGVSADAQYVLNLDGIPAGVYIIKVYAQPDVPIYSAKLAVY